MRNNINKKLIKELDLKTQCLIDIDHRLVNIMVLTKEMSIKNDDYIQSAILDLMHKELRTICEKINNSIIPF